jgi:GH35 family endo-1,4-beta-xylanase
MIGLHVTDNAAWPADVSHARIWDMGVHWGAVHTGPGQYAWAALDAIVDRLHGKHITYVIAGCPQWLAKYPNQAHYAPWLGPGSNSMPSNQDTANEFIWNLATRYKGRIKAYEIWNEPQLADFLYPWNDTERNALAQLTKRAYSTIKSCDSKALVLAASVLPRDSSGGMERGKKYWTALKKKGWNVDAFTCHIYPEVGYWAPRWKDMLDVTVSTLKMMEPPTTKLWITETAFGLLGPQLTDAAAIDKAVKAVYDAANDRFLYWYAWARPDLGGMLVADGTPGWSAIRKHHDL